MAKRLLCLFICMSVLLSCGITFVSAKTFADVPESNDYHEAIDILSDFGIILGDAGSNNFRPKSHISREEFSVIVTRILGVSNLKADLTNLPFSDVTPETCDEWSINATKVAYDMGIIAGYGDGTFGPKDAVTYVQVVKMLVCALGYGSTADENGGWPTGYLKVGNDLGITDNAVMDANAYAPRGIVAQLVYNCLEIDLMEKVNETDYRVQPGRNILTDKLGYKYGEGVITGIPGKAFDHIGKRISEGEVEIDGEIVSAGTLDIVKYFGHRGSYYYKEKNNTRTLVSFSLMDDNKSYTAQNALIERLDANGIVYYLSENDKSQAELEFSGDTVYLFNGRPTDIDDITEPNIGDVYMMDNDGDEIIDLVEINDSRVFVVSSVDSANKVLFNKYDANERLVLNDSAEVTITKNKQTVNFATIKKDDVLLVTENTGGAYNIYNIEVITKTKSGTVESVSDEDIYSIDGTTYEAAPAYVHYMEENPGEGIAVGDKVTVYLDEKNDILYAERQALNAKIGYLVAVGPDDDKELTQLKIFNSAGTMQIVNCAEHMTINGIVMDWDEIEDELASTNHLTNKDEDATRAATSQLIKYTTTSNGEVDAIITMTESGDKTRELVLGKGYDASTTTTYYTSTRTFSNTKVALGSSTKVFFVPSDRGSDDEYAVKTYSGLTNNTAYKIEAYDMTATGLADYVIVYASEMVNEIWGNPALITAENFVQNDSGSTVYRITFIMNGNEVTRETKNRAVYSGCKVGDIVRYATDSKGVISKIDKIFDPENPDFTLQNEGAEGMRYYRKSPVNSDTNAYYLTICGTVYSRDEERMVLSLEDVDAEGNLSEGEKLYTINFSTGTKYFVYDKTENKNKLKTDATKDYIAGWVDVGAGATRIMMYANYTNLRFVYIIIE